VATNTGAIINSQADVGGWPAIAQYTRAASWDSDGDGMPDWWELDRGSNPLVADNNVLTPSGYTQLENYLNYITSTSNWGVDANGNWSASANWLGGAPSAVDMLAGFNDAVRGAAFSGPRTVTVDSPQTVGVINFDSATSFTINGSATITLDDSSGAAAINV